MTELEEKQASCPYCHGDYIIIGDYTELELDLEHQRIVACGDDEVYLNDAQYCPMCGRKLGEDK